MDNTNVSYGSAGNGQNSSVPKSSTKYYVIMMLLGISVFMAATSLIAPRIILWWYDSPAPTPITAACVPAIDWAIRMLQSAQLVSVAVGALAGLFLGFRFRKKPQSNPLNTR